MYILRISLKNWIIEGLIAPCTECIHVNKGIIGIISCLLSKTDSAFVFHMPMFNSSCHMTLSSEKKKKTNCINVVLIIMIHFE